MPTLMVGQSTPETIDSSLNQRMLAPTSDSGVEDSRPIPLLSSGYQNIQLVFM